MELLASSSWKDKFLVGMDKINLMVYFFRKVLVLVNGTFSCFFKVWRDWGKVTPFLLYLFVIAMEALSSLLVRAKEGHFLLSLRVEGIGEAGEGISHLLLAYDTAVFCEAFGYSRGLKPSRVWKLTLIRVSWLKLGGRQYKGVGLGIGVNFQPLV